MASSRGYGRRGSNRLADMSLPAEARRTPKKRKASNPAARRKRRDGERAMDRERR